jgi:hypothetical protein
VFDVRSRYARSTPYVVTDRRGHAITIVETPDAPAERLVGYHLRHQGERVDHLASAYLGDPAGAWRIHELADVMLPDALAEAREIPIPDRNR